MTVDAVVTGAGGFAGRWLCRHLALGGARVEGWGRDEAPSAVEAARWRQVDVTRRDAVRRGMERARPAVVYHLAAVSSASWAESHPTAAAAVNVGGARNVAEAAASVGARLVLASSCHVYGNPVQLPVKPEATPAPRGVYGRTKLDAEAAACDAGGDVVIARAFHHAGPGQGARFAIPGWARALAAGVAAVRVGDLSLRRDYSDVRDIVAGYAVLAASAPAGAVVDLCSGHAEPLSEVLRLLAGGAMPPVVVDPDLVRPGEPPLLLGCPERAEGLGWTRRYALEQTLEDVMTEALSLRGCP